MWKKSLSVLWPGQKNDPGPHWQKWAKNPLSAKSPFVFANQENWNWFFSQKNNFQSYRPRRKISIIADSGFLAYFCQFGPGSFFWPGHKTESDFFHIKMTFDFLSGHFWWSEKCAIVMTQTLFLIFVIRGCHRGI